MRNERCRQGAMARRGCDLSLEEAQEFARSLMRLVELGSSASDNRESDQTPEVGE